MNIEQKTQEKLALKIAQSELESAQWQAHYEEEVALHKETKKHLEQFQAVLDNNADLKELFEEELNKGE